MADSKLLSISLQEDELCCPVCFDEFEEPKALPQCLHNFCKKCLGTMATIRGQCLVVTIECPTCRTISSLPEGSVDKLPTNNLLKSLVERIPGGKEKLELKKIIQECEKKVTFCHAKHQEKTSSLKHHEEALQRMLQTRKEICDHAKYLMDMIQERSRTLCFEINNHIAEVSSLIAKHEQCNDNLINITSKANDYLENAKAMLKRNDRQEILGNHKAIEAEIQRLNDSILFQISDANSLDGNPKEMELRKMNEETSGENIFGVLQQSNKRSNNNESSCFGSFPALQFIPPKQLPHRYSAPVPFTRNSDNPFSSRYEPAQDTNTAASLQYQVRWSGLGF